MFYKLHCIFTITAARDSRVLSFSRVSCLLYRIFTRVISVYLQVINMNEHGQEAHTMAKCGLDFRKTKGRGGQKG